jgi:hypothetical protein
VEAMARERVEREWERAERAEALAKERVEREKERAVHSTEAARERFEREKMRQEAVFLQEKVALELKMKEMEAKAKDMEIANLRLQLELEKSQKKRGAEDHDGGGGGSRKRSSAVSEVSSSPLLVLMPYEDPMTREAFRGQGRKYRWVLIYSADRALGVSDFKEEVKRVATTALSNNEWMTLVVFKEKFRSVMAPGFVRGLHSSGRITGRALIEAPWSATHRFLLSAVQHNEIQKVLLDSPSLEREDDVTYCKMRLVAE